MINFESYGNRNGKINHETDNLLIKGNNLLALHSLLPKYRGRVKLIYIDPPYNTGNDGFKYNDAFNHSTWLVFMKNRLEVARQLLSDDGVILVSINDKEHAYLKVLMDEVFGRESYKNDLIWYYLAMSSNPVGKFRNAHEKILFYANKKFKNINQQTQIKYKFSNVENVVEKLANKLHKNYYELMSYLGYEYDENIKSWFSWYNKTTQTKDFFNTQYDDVLYVPPVNRMAIERLNEFDNQKPERLIELLISFFTNPGDLVLDFFAGSGTTAAVAHKMGRRWITIEQMDYVETITKVRLQKVLDGEQGGVSKNHKWQGGGSFVYFELL